MFHPTRGHKGPATDIDPREEKVLNYVKQHPEIQHSRLVDHFVDADANTEEHMANRTVQQKIKSLIQARLLAIRYEGKRKFYSLAVLDARDIATGFRSHVGERDAELRLVRITYSRLRTREKAALAVNLLSRLFCDLNSVELLKVFGKFKKEHDKLEKHVQNNIRNIYGVIIHDKEYSMVLPRVLQAFSTGELVTRYPLSTILMKGTGR
jgi:hypothetical protein